MTRLDQRALDLEGRVVRGADVGGLLGPLEIEVATAERDLIVAAAARVAARRDRDEVLARRAQLETTAAAVAGLEARCVAVLTAAPTLAIPQVRALGEVPTGAGRAGGIRGEARRGEPRPRAGPCGLCRCPRGARGGAGTGRGAARRGGDDPADRAAAGDLAALTRLVGEAGAATPPTSGVPARSSRRCRPPHDHSVEHSPTTRKA